MKDSVLDLCIIIPSYNPDDKLVKVVEGLRAKGFHDIIVVNDGSDSDHQKPFEQIDKDCTVIHHKVNKGKGRAMKTAFSFCLDNRKNSAGIITVDGDNQHHADDVYACGKALLDNPEQLVLGCRNFSGDDVPARSKFGNTITKNVFRFLCGIKISDTQTGLRAFATNRLEEMLEIKGERYEYETNMLLETKNYDIPVREIPIRTIYLDENNSSHFNPIKDSIKIYGIIIKFFINSIASTGIDLLLFFIANLLLHHTVLQEAAIIFLATAFARVCSSLFNYTMNRKVVFGRGNATSIVKYYILCVCQMTVSAGIVFLLSSFLASSSFMTTVIKAITDTCLFFISFRIQKDWVFHKPQVKKEHVAFSFRTQTIAKKMK